MNDAESYLSSFLASERASKGEDHAIWLLALHSWDVSLARVELNRGAFLSPVRTDVVPGITLSDDAVGKRLKGRYLTLQLMVKSVVATLGSGHAIVENDAFIYPQFLTFEYLTSFMLRDDQV